MTNTAALRPTPAQHDAVVNPVTGRPATSLQGGLMLTASALPLLGSVLLAPILPALSEVYAGVPGVHVLVPLVVSTPSLFIALCSPLVGRMIDLIGRKLLLVAALVVYALFGTAPLYLDSLWAILATRVGVGASEAVILTCCTALMGDYFTGNRRNRYMGLQTVVMATSATAFLVIGGVLGSAGWRTPFWLYLASLALLVPVVLFIWSPAPVEVRQQQRRELAPLPWRRLALPCAVSVFGGVVFYAITLQLPYVLRNQGVESIAVIGTASALASLAIAVGAFSFRWVARHGVARLIPLVFALSAIGLVVLWASTTPTVATIGGAITSLGAGLMFPTLLIWALSGLTYEQRGRGTGRFTAAIYIGQFASPLVVAALAAAAGGERQDGLAVLGLVCVVVTVALVVILARGTAPSLVHAEPVGTIAEPVGRV